MTLLVYYDTLHYSKDRVQSNNRIENKAFLEVRTALYLKNESHDRQFPRAGRDDAESCPRPLPHPSVGYIVLIQNVIVISCSPRCGNCVKASTQSSKHLRGINKRDALVIREP